MEKQTSAPFIDSVNRNMFDALTDALKNSDRVDIAVGYFFFSGFKALAESFKDKKIRILVGKEIDPACVPDIIKYSKLNNHESLEKWAPRKPTNSALQLKQNYVDALVEFVNNSDTFDEEVSESAFKMFAEKIANGSLEIKVTKRDNPYHGKLYLLHNKQEIQDQTKLPGTVIVGSSNLTWSGLIGQGELNKELTSTKDFEGANKIFLDLWDSSDAITVADLSCADEFLATVKEKLWIYQQPTPYELYMRVLHELFKKPDDFHKIQTPSSITDGAFLDLEYQTDAIRIALDRLDKFDGVIIADVVGLGKSIIGSAVANNLGMNTVILAPPHLVPQWEDYKEIFGIKGSKVYSSGNIPVVYEKYADSSRPILLIIDEAHRFRNEDTNDYKLLHQICRSNPDNKVILLTATPFNNSPQDIFALMKFFQTPGRATIRSVDNLSMRFRELIAKYKKLRVELRKSSKANLEKEKKEIAGETRRFLEPIVIRRSRLDLEKISRYKKDLESQNISFPTIQGPTLLTYDLKKLSELYIDTLNKISSDQTDQNQGYIGARYKPATYVKEREKFLEKFGEAFDDGDLKVAQTNLSEFMRKLLVMRFESSKYAFRTTLERMIANNKLIINWWSQMGIVPIMKKGNLPDPDDFALDDGIGLDDFESKLEKLRESKGLLEVPAEWIDEKFILDVTSDTKLLEQIHHSWFEDADLALLDPKLDELEMQIKKLLAENPGRKIVVFSSYADTVNSIANGLSDRGMAGVLAFTAADSSRDSRKILLSNFDASYALGPQQDEYQVLICTDALSEGVNLHRAGVIFNYDIPYNPTRVVQRIGRINRINKKVFDVIHIYNFFPTVIGNSIISIRAIATLKKALINSIMGDDVRALTPDENLETFFMEEFVQADEGKEDLSWDAVFIEEYENAIKVPSLLQKIELIPRRSRISRSSQQMDLGLVFSKHGQSTIFISAQRETDPEILSTEEALRLFKADPEEQGSEVSQKFAPLFKIVRDKLDSKHELPVIKGRRNDALNLLEALRIQLPAASSYCVDLIRIIRDLDDIDEGTLKDLAQIREKTPEKIFELVKSAVPESHVRNILARVQRMEDEAHTILLAEEFQK
jgi:superfamily II DNA or RNA helicase/HKD family nuclease